MSDTLLLTKEERREESRGEVGGGEGGTVGCGVVERKGGGWVRFLIEFPDNAEINLTPVKFDYISGAVLSLLSCPPPVLPSQNARVSSLSSPPPLAHTAFVSVVASKRY